MQATKNARPSKNFLEKLISAEKKIPQLKVRKIEKKNYCFLRWHCYQKIAWQEMPQIFLANLDDEIQVPHLDSWFHDALSNDLKRWNQFYQKEDGSNFPLTNCTDSSAAFFSMPQGQVNHLFILSMFECLRKKGWKATVSLSPSCRLFQNSPDKVWKQLYSWVERKEKGGCCGSSWHCAIM